MLGLRSQEESKFIPFFEIIQRAANIKKSTFFLDCGEGHSLWDDNIICTDCSGWLIPNDKVEEFRTEYENFLALDKWEKYVAWVTWKKEKDNILVNIELL